MSFQFRACTLDQPLLLAPSLQQWLPEGHLARFLADVTEQLDLSAIYSAYDRPDGRGQAGYHPLLMTRLLLYGYCVGVARSPAIERKRNCRPKWKPCCAMRRKWTRPKIGNTGRASEAMNCQRNWRGERVG